MKATAYDTFYPDNKANTTVKITVRRNQNEPQFSQSAYNTEINEYHQFGVTVFTVSAADADRVRIQVNSYFLAIFLITWKYVSLLYN